MFLSLEKPQSLFKYAEKMNKTVVELLEREEKNIYMGYFGEISLSAKCWKYVSAPMGLLHVSLIHLTFLKFVDGEIFLLQLH